MKTHPVHNLNVFFFWTGCWVFADKNPQVTPRVISGQTSPGNPPWQQIFTTAFFLFWGIGGFRVLLGFIRRRSASPRFFFPPSTPGHLWRVDNCGPGLSVATLCMSYFCNVWSESGNVGVHRARSRPVILRFQFGPLRTGYTFVGLNLEAWSCQCTSLLFFSSFFFFFLRARFVTSSLVFCHVLAGGPPFTLPSPLCLTPLPLPALYPHCLCFPAPPLRTKLAVCLQLD